MNLQDIFTNPTATAAFSLISAYLIASALRQWWNIPPLPVALVVSVVVYVIGAYASPEAQNIILSVLGVIFATLAAAGVNVALGSVQRLIQPGEDEPSAPLARATSEDAKSAPSQPAGWTAPW